MSTTTPLTDSINALTTYANEVTGASDTTLSDAVYTLAQGYGQGDTPTGMSITTFTKEATTEQTVAHGLGDTPDTIFLIPVNTPSGYGNSYPHVITGFTMINGYPLHGDNALIKQYQNGSRKWDYTSANMGWEADATNIYLGANTSSLIPTGDYILIAYKYQ